MNRVILGKGLLGKELYDKTGWDCLFRSKDNFDFTDINSYKGMLQGYDEVVNCIANTDTYGGDYRDHWNVNYRGVSELSDFCNSTNKKLIHISTAYVYANSKPNATEEDPPVPCATWYGVTKLLADGCITLSAGNYLILRVIYKEFPFKYDTAFYNQLGNFDYLPVIADLIVKLVENDARGIYNVGTDVKSIYQLAQESRQDVKPVACSIANMPLDTTMSLCKMREFLKSKGVSL